MKFFATTKKLFDLFLVFAVVVCANGCAELSELKKPQPSSFYGEGKPPQTNEFRWANGEQPKNFDPVFARTPSEMQAVRAAFDGLTDWDAQTLRAIPALAAKWETSDDARTWTFYLRPNAVWSNNKKITAKDFARAWRRVLESDEKSTHKNLLANVVGANKIIENSKLDLQPSPEDSSPAVNNSNPQTATSVAQKSDQADGEIVEKPTTNESATEEQTAKNKEQKTDDDFWFGVEAVDDITLRIFLVEPDENFAEVAAHSALRPILGDSGEFEKADQIAKIVTSGAFRFAENGKNGLLLERSPNYWNADAVKIEKIRFVPLKNAETALASYRAGEVDAVTNVQFEPLALKLLQSYKDFKRTRFNAVAFYEFNIEHKPFDDARVRKALSIAIDRDQLVNDELDGANFAANTFLPDSAVKPLKFDLQQARKLLAEAGFGAGKDFPKIKLLINHNDAQRRVARGVAAQWRKNLNIETEIVTSSLSELDDRETTEDFDLVRRTIVLPTPAATVNLRAIFKLNNDSSAAHAVIRQTPVQQQLQKTDSQDKTSVSSAPEQAETEPRAITQLNEVDAAPENLPENSVQPESSDDLIAQAGDLKSDGNAIFFDEAAALNQMTAIPLYFPSSYTLVKPYITGFDANLLDAPLLKNVQIEADWQADSPQ